MLRSMFVGVLLSGLSFATDAQDGKKPIVLSTDARVEIDAEGKPVKVEASQDLPDGVREFVERQLSQWKFERIERDGVAGNAVTWISLHACALPQENGTYVMGTAYGGHGPRLADGAKWRAPADLFPIVARSGADGHANVNFIVHADGTARFDSIDGMTNLHLRRQMTPVFTRWIANNRFDPEEVGGKAVATRSTVPVRFYGGSAKRSADRAYAAEWMASPACQRAGMTTAPDMNAVATDSVVSIVPTF